ncbi:MAG: RHS repeat protein, partial [Proteobacteria bacterium]|nr:RHS repeat protein [Pseudomonadota bacterium]
MKTFDYRGRPTEIVRSGNEITKIDYTGFSTKITDPENSVKETARDYLGRITRVDEDLGGGSTFYSYNVAGDLSKIKDAYDNEIVFRYDSLGRKISMDDPNLGHWDYRYDVSGNLIEVIDPRPDATNEELANSFSYERDGMGRVIRETREIDLVPGPSIFQYEHDFSGKLTKLTYPDGFWVEYGYYPGSGLLHTVTGSNGVQFARYEDYTPQGKIGSIYYGNGASTTYTYDQITKRLNHIQTLGSDRGIIQDRRYKYNKTGDLITMELGPTDGYHLFFYDKIQRLISVTGLAWGYMNYEYDKVGNITMREIYNNLSTEPYRLYEYEYGPEKPHAVKSVTVNGLSHSFTYDEAGNIVHGRDLSDPTSPPERWINFNCFNKPKEVYVYSAGLTRKSSFVYDGDK